MAEDNQGWCPRSGSAVDPKNDQMVFSDLIAKLPQRLQHPPAIGWRPLIKRYVEGDARVHVHLWQRDSDDLSIAPRRDPGEWCVVLEWPKVGLPDDIEIEVRATWERFLRLHVGDADKHLHGVDGAVLVDVPEFLEHRQRVPFGIRLPTSRRLQTLDMCPHHIGYAPRRFPEAPLPVRIPVDDDGETDPFPFRRDGRRRIGVDAEGESPREMVQSRAESVHDVSDHGPPPNDLGIRGIADDPSIEDDFAWMLIRVQLGFNSVGMVIDKRLNRLLERANVYIR